MAGLGTYWRTLRYLKPVQLAARLRNMFPTGRADLRPAPPLRTRVGTWVAPAQRERTLVGPGKLRLLNVERALDECGWDDPSVDRLWRYHLHYFDDLNARGAETRRAWHLALIERWLKDNPPAQGTGWEPYPTSLRIVNWIKWFLGGAAADPRWIHSLAIQARWLRKRLEWHLLGNHLFANAKALVFAGLFFEGPEAQGWLKVGERLLRRELDEQILSDGGHFERSPMYHAIIVEDVLDLMNVIGAFARDGESIREFRSVLAERARRMLHWLRTMSHPDGGISFFNDAADGIAPSNDELEAYATRLGMDRVSFPSEGVIVLDASGYVRMSRGPAVAILDIAPLGPDYLPGHGHADTLSFELSIGQRRIVVNGGTSCYGLSEQRLRERGTAWHSTVEIAGRNSSEIWSSFRVGRRARPGPIRVDGWCVEGVHDGYAHLPGSPQHRRRWTMGDRELVVEDHVWPDRHRAVARFHLAPDLRLEATSAPNRWRVCDSERCIADVVVETGQARIASSHRAPRFGVLVPAQTLEVELESGRASCRWRWRVQCTYCS